MPQKAYERNTFHVMAYAIFFRNAPFHFRFLFCLKIDHVRFFRCPIFLLLNAAGWLSASVGGMHAA